MEQENKQEREETCTDFRCGCEGKETTCCGYEVNVEHLEDGYRITVRGDQDEIQKQRRVANRYIDFLQEQQKAGWWLPRPLRWLLKWLYRFK